MTIFQNLVTFVVHFSKHTVQALTSIALARQLSVLTVLVYVYTVHT